MKVLVTGGAGFIGGNHIHFLLENYEDINVTNLDLLTYAGDLSKHEKYENDSRYTFVEMDIADREAVLELFQQNAFEYVLHFAAESHVDRSIEDPSAFVRTNVLGTQVLLDAALKNKVKKFVHISTDEVYGELELDGDDYFTEETPLQPNSPYSASKASSDLLVRAYHETYGMPVNITRCSNNYGPFQFPEKLIPLTIQKLSNGEKVPVYGDGSNIRDWLHVSDHCSAVDLVMREGVDGEVYNIGGHNEKTNLELVKTIIKEMGKTEESIEFVKDRLGHDKRYAIDPKKIEKLGWKSKYEFNEGIKKLIN
ncbi:dTDP-glucose 4,6-dehydratase [Salisediminibacterium beveridgei]|uniref:dTDP-glucose 4,6-dehydratase n=1 Tax=Salisediminibacterium beveridgei TaxID=632773 RepID=A0A1D7QRN3_9BACI|nr:dTDP-glucose 4,6-dehydratase [Salisediminibacterium beveridgei]AOM81666.1 dTDP-glucose 4,6-dehydratase [Salisediminibacterium beveridgei]